KTNRANSFSGLERTRRWLAIGFLCAIFRRCRRARLLRICFGPPGRQLRLTALIRGFQVFRGRGIVLHPLFPALLVRLFGGGTAGLAADSAAREDEGQATQPQRA